MKTASAALQQHLTQETTTLARLWKITRLDGAVLRYTDFDKDIPFNDGATTTVQLAFSAAASGAVDFTSTTASTVAATTSGLGINFIVVAANEADTTPAADLSLADTINSVPSGNVWTKVPTNTSTSAGVDGIPIWFYCYTTNTGPNHVFTVTTTNANRCPRIAVQAFSGMPAGAPEGPSGWFGTGGTYPFIPTTQTSSKLLSPINQGDLILVASGIGISHGRTVTCDSGVTISCQSILTSMFGISAGYLLSPFSSAACTGTVTVLDPNTATVNVAPTASFIAPQTCTGNVNFTASSADIYLASTVGFRVGMPVYMSGFTSAGVLNGQTHNISAVAADHVTVVSNGSWSVISYTGQTAGAVYMSVTLSGFSGSVAPLNTAIGPYVSAVGSGTVTVVTGGLTAGTYTGQAGVVGLPVNPQWGWGAGLLSNEAAAGMVIFPSPTATGSVYKSLEDGITASATQYASDGSPDNLTITGFLADDGINEHDVRAHLFDNATVEIRVVNWADLTQGCLKLLGGVVGDVKLNNGAYEVDCRGLAQRLSTSIGSNYGPCCRAELFDGGVAGNPANRWKCRLNRADWVQTSSVVSSPDALTIVPASGLKMRGSSTPTAAAGAGWFADGVITFTSGVLEDYSFEIASWDGVTLTLFAGAPLPCSPSASDTFEIEPGCDKTKPTCQGKFSNIVNFAGEAEIPGLLVIAAQGVPQV